MKERKRKGEQDKHSLKDKRLIKRIFIFIQ